MLKLRIKVGDHEFAFEGEAALREVATLVVLWADVVTGSPQAQRKIDALTNSLRTENDTLLETVKAHTPTT